MFFSVALFSLYIYCGECDHWYYCSVGIFYGYVVTLLHRTEDVIRGEFVEWNEC